MIGMRKGQLPDVPILTPSQVQNDAMTRSALLELLEMPIKSELDRQLISNVLSSDHESDIDIDDTRALHDLSFNPALDD